MCYVLQMTDNISEEQRLKLRAKDAKKRARVKRFIQRVKSNSGCILCEYDHCVDALDFHHLVDKDDNLSKCTSFVKASGEMLKCVVVCANCHREIHAGLYEHDWLIDLMVSQDDVLRARSES